MYCVALHYLIMSDRLCYFVADVHLGLDYNSPIEREKKFVSFLNSLPNNTTDLFLLGDIFDFWYEYKDVIPNKFTRTLGALASVADRGIKIHFFNGNHDVWTYRYFQKEIGVIMHKQPSVIKINDSYFCLGHGDGLWDKSVGYSILKSIFNCRFLQKLFSALHPRFAFLLGDKWSKHNRLVHTLTKEQYEKLKGEQMKKSVGWAADFQSKNKDTQIDYFIFGHTHTPLEAINANGSKMFILGDWIYHPDYILFKEGELYRVNIE